MQRSAFFSCAFNIIICCLLSVTSAFAESASSEWDVTSLKVDLLNHQGANGDIQVDQNGWVHLGANHLEGGDLTYLVKTGRLTSSDILEVWVDGFSSSNSLDIGPTLFIGPNKNRFEQLTRISGDAWRPFVFRFADDSHYGDVTDPSNRNESWRIRYPSSKYEVRRIDKAPNELLNYQTLPIRISITGAEDFVIKRLEVVVYRAGHGYRVPSRRHHIVNVDPSRVHRGGRITVQLSPEAYREDLDYYIIDADGREHRVYPQLESSRERVCLSAQGDAFSGCGRYRVKVVDRKQRYSDSKSFDYVCPRVVKKIKATPTPAPVLDSCASPCLPKRAPGPVVPQILPAVPPPPPVIKAASLYHRDFTIQVGAFMTQGSAISLVDKLRSLGYDAYISEVTQNNCLLFRVRVGRYAGKSYARQDARSLRQRGFDTWITTMS